MKTFPLLLLISLTFACTEPASDQGTEEQSIEESAHTDNGLGVYFENITDLDTLTSPFVTLMKVDGMIVEPKGKPKDGVGHHHLIINEGFVEEGIFIAADSTHVHYGGGQTTDTVSLTPGKYMLTLQFADGMHMSYGEAWAKSYTVYVK